MAVHRYDRAELRLDAKSRTPQGFLRVDAAIARTGVQFYRQPDGKVRREYRPPEEVFRADALATCSLAPLTLRHPPEMLTPQNVAKYRKGTVGETVRQDGHLVVTSIVIEDADAISAVETGAMRQLSCGYYCDTDETPGVAPDGSRYDAVQRNIRVNHVALEPMGRAGPEVRVRLDATDAVQVDEDPPPTPKQEKKMATKKIRIDGVEAELEDTVAQLVEKQQAQLDAARDSATKAKAEADQAKARADAADAARAKAEATLKEATDPAKLQAAARARADLEQKAAKVGPKAKFDGLDDMAVKRAALADAGVKVEGKSDAYVEARFDLALEETEKKNPAATARAAGTPEAKADADDVIETARAKQRKDSAEAWKQPLASNKDAVSA